MNGFPVNGAGTGAGASPAHAADFQGGVLPKGALSFGAGETSKVITVNVAGDTTVEGNDGFVVRLSGATGGTLGTATAAGHITNDDAGSGGSPGKVLTATHVGSTLTGGAGDDTLNASQADDTLTGGAGADRFVFGLEPWSPAHITDFKPGEDKIDLSALFDKAGYAGSDPVREGYLYLQSDGGDGTLVRFDRDGAGPNPQWPNTIIDVEHVAPSQLSLGDWIV